VTTSGNPHVRIHRCTLNLGILWPFYHSRYTGLANVIRLLNQKLATEIPEIDLSREHYKEIQEVQKVLGYETFIDSDNKLLLCELIAN
jgi:hypothetical protein